MDDSRSRLLIKRMTLGDVGYLNGRRIFKPAVTAIGNVSGSNVRMSESFLYASVRAFRERRELSAVSGSAAAETVVDDASVLSYEAKLNSAQLQHFKSQDEAIIRLDHQRNAYVRCPYRCKAASRGSSRVSGCSAN